MQEIPINTLTSSSVILELILRLKVKDVMSTNVITATKETSLRHIQEIMRTERVTGLPIVMGKRLVGIVSMDDIIKALDLGYIEDPAQDHMSQNLIVLDEEMPVSFAINYFSRYRYHRFPVLNKYKHLVGMVTNRDITTVLLVEINKEVEQLEKNAKVRAHATEMSGEVHTYPILKNDFENAGSASTQIKKRLKEAKIPNAIIRRAAIASYELEMNMVVHSNGGFLKAEYTPTTLVLTAQDEGPGISDLEAALTPGWSTASEWIRSLGFGAGMGLPNVKSVSDAFFIESDVRGTIVSATIILEPTEDADERQRS